MALYKKKKLIWKGIIKEADKERNREREREKGHECRCVYWGGVHVLGVGKEDKTRSSRTKSGKTGKGRLSAVIETLATLPGPRASLSAR